MKLTSVRHLLLISCACLPAHGQGIIETIAGKDFAFTGNGAPAVSVPLGAIPSVATDSQGNFYYSDIENQLVLKTGADGVLHVVAGNGIPGYSGDGGPATSASLNGPFALAVDAAGNIYVSESFSHRIRRITPAGIISTFAGSGQPDTSGDGGPAIAAGTGQEISGMVCDAKGNLYLSQIYENVVREIGTDGVITTVAGTGQRGFSGDGGAAVVATLAAPLGLALDAHGNLLIADSSNYRIRSVSPAGTISTIAGGGFASNDGIAATTALMIPLGIVLDASGNLYLNDYLSARVRVVDSGGIITTVAGSGERGFSGDGGPALAAAFATPFGLALDGGGNVFVGDFGVSRVRKIGRNGIISTVAGNGQFKPSPEGAAGPDTGLRFPWGITALADGSLVISERTGARIRRIGPNGIVSTVAGNGETGISPDGGQATSAVIALPNGVGVDQAGDVYFSEEIGFKVRKVTPSGALATEAGTGLISATASNGVPATNSSLGFPYGLTLDPAGNVYFTDGGQNLVRKVSPAGIISTVAGNGLAGFSGDNGPALAASLNTPSGVAVDSAGNIYISDSGNLRVRKVSTTGVITTIAGNGQAAYSGEGGAAARATLSPNGIALDTAGNLYIADADNNRVLRIAPSGVIGTVAGNGQAGSTGDGGLATLASLNGPNGVAVDSKGNIYITDTGNGRVRVVLAAPATFTISTNSLSFTGKSTGAVTASQNVQVTGSLAGLPFTVAVSTANGSAWLQTSLQRGTMPVALGISADPSKLQPGNYQGTVTITAAGAQPAVQNVAVSFSVTAADPPNLSVKTDALTFSLGQGQSPATRTLAVSNLGGGSIAVTSSATTAAGGNWLSVSSAQTTATANAPASITVTADPSRLGPGTYLGQLTIGGSTGQDVVVPVTMIVSPVQQELLLTSQGFTFQAVAGGGVVPPQSFGIANIGNGGLNWTAAPGPSWLALTASSGSSTAGAAVPQVGLNVNPGSLAPGVYYDKVTVTAPQAGNAPQIVSTVLNVVAPGATPAPVVQPAGLLFTATAGDVSPGSQTVILYNLGTSPLSFNSSRLTLDGADWFVHLPATGVVNPQEPLPIVVQPNLNGLAPGIYNGVITLLFSAGSTQTINLLFVVAPAGSTPAGRRTASAGCAPTKLAPLFTSFSSSFTGPVGWPTPVALQVADDCGSPLTSGSVVVTFNNGDPPLALNSLGAGQWSGTWTPRSAAASVTMIANAQSNTGLTGQTQSTGASQQNVGAPLLQPNAIVNAAWPAAPVPLAPGSLVSLFGLGLAASPQTAQGFPLPYTMAGTSVIMAGRELPLLYAANGQVNTLIPYDMAFNTRQQLFVQIGTQLTTPQPVSIAAAQPVIFAASGWAGGQGLIYDTANGTQILADSQNPAAAGDQILIAASGLGAVDPAFDSSIVPIPPFPRTTNTVSLTIGGVPAQVVSATLSPGVPGLYYVLAIVPTGVTPGNAAPVILSAAGESSPVVSMAVK